MISDITSPNFFVSPTGKSDPKSELKATIESFFDVVGEDASHHQLRQCQFPLRFAWLKEELNLDQAPLQVASCRRFKEWLGDPQSLDLIFADSYLGNPSSMFGHIFLRVNQGLHSENERLLDLTINFSAEAHESAFFKFAAKGLLGGFSGKFSAAPYYLKVKEYAHLEARDLWEYRLKFNSNSVRRLLMHVWELDEADFDYFFLTRNCAYQLLPLFDAADPTLHLSRYSRVGVIPSDAVRLLAKQPGFSEIRLRPSLSSSLFETRNLLSAKEKLLVDRLSRAADENKHAVDALPVNRQTIVIDAAYDLARYRRNSGNNLWDDQLSKSEKTLMGWRQSQISPLSIPGIVYHRVSPESGHGTAMLGGAVGFDENGAFGEYLFRPALHDALANQDGYLQNSQLELMGLRLRTNATSGLYLQQLDLLNVASYQPWDSWLRKPSWKFYSGFRQAEEKGCHGDDCMIFTLGGGYGGSVQFEQPGRPLFYALLDWDLGAGDPLDKSWRLGGGGSAGMLLQSTPLRTQLEFSHIRYPLGDGNPDTLVKLGMTWMVMRNWEIRTVLLRRNPHHELSLGLRFYF